MRRNRDFVLLQAGQLLSTTGSESTAIAYPLLVLALTHSPAKAGLVTFARLLPNVLFNLPAGLAADRWNRKLLMLAADVVRAAAMVGLGAAILADRATFWSITFVAFAEGTGSVLFATASSGALRSVVEARLLPAAAGVQEGRKAAVRIGGAPLGGALFGLGRTVPFLVDAASYMLSIASLLAMRTPFQEVRETDSSRLRTQLAEGFRFLWSRPFLRTCALLYGLGNFLVPGVLLVVVVLGRRDGLSGAEIGALFAVFGASTLAGSVASPFLRKALSVRAILLMELWTWLATWAFVVHPSVYVLAVAILPFGFAAPVTDSVVVGYRLAMTPDRLVGRVESVRSSISLLIAPLGPLAAGLLLAHVSARATVACFATFGLALALWGTLSPPIRNAPALADLDDLAPSPAGLP